MRPLLLLSSKDLTLVTEGLTPDTSFILFYSIRSELIATHTRFEMSGLR